MTRPLALMLAATALATPLASAQFAPPPLEQSKPLAMPVVKIPDRSAFTDPKIEKEAEQRAKRLEELRQLRSEAALPDMEFESLIAYDDDGRVVRLAGLPEYVALDRHPMVSDRVRPRIDGAIADRRHHIERSMLEHLEAVELIESGKLDRLSAFDMDGLKHLRHQLEPLVGKENALAELQRVGALTPVQVRFLRDKMVRPYKQALSEDLNSYQQYDADGNPVSLYDAIVRQAMREQVGEVMGIYHDLLVEASERATTIGSVIDALNADPDLAGRLIETTKPLAGADRPTRLAAMQELMASLAIDQRRTLLETALDTRE